MASFSSAMSSLAGPIAKKVLTSLGVGVVTYVGVEAAVRAAFGYAKANFAMISPAVSQILAMAGMYTAMGIIAGGVMAGVSMLILNKFAKLT